MTEYGKAHLDGARWALGLDMDSTTEETEAARDQHLANPELLAAARRDRDEARNLLTLANIERDELTAKLNTLRTFADAANAAAASAFRLCNIARDERDEARRLHATAVEELARVKMGRITADQIELFIWRSGWDDQFSATCAEVERFAKALAQHMRGAP